jgi:hypothetical protein
MLFGQEKKHNLVRNFDNYLPSSWQFDIVVKGSNSLDTVSGKYILGTQK